MSASRSKALFSGLRNCNFVAALLLLSACETVLPKAETFTASPWATFAEAKAAYDKIAIDLTTVDDLGKLGFDPYRTPNALILLNRDLVVYKLWRGKPMIHEEKKTKKLLGPIQDAGGLLRDQIGP